MKKIKTANLLYAAFLIVSGSVILIGNLFEEGNWHLMASFLILFGLLLPFSAINNYIEDKLFMHITLVLIILTGIAAGFLFFYGYVEGIELNRERIIYFLVSLVSLPIIIIYIAHLLDLRRLGKRHDRP